MKIFLFILVVFLAIPEAPLCDETSRNLSQLNKINWVKTYGDSERTYYNKASFFEPINKFLYVSGIYSLAKKGRPQSEIDGIWVIKLDQEGNKQLEFKLKNLSYEKMNFFDIEAMTVTDEKNIIIVCRLITKETVLISFDATGTVLFSKKLNEGVHVSKILKTLDKKLLLIGHKYLNAYVSKYDKSGKILWKKELDRGKSELFVDGLIAAQGDLILLENSGDLEQFFMGKSRVWLSKFDSKGGKKYEQSFPGRSGSISLAKNGNIVIVYDNSNSGKQNIFLRKVNKMFNKINEIEITTIPFGLAKFEVFSLQNDNFLVSGALNNRPHVTYVSSGGEKDWYFEGGSLSPAVGTNYTKNQNTCFIVSSVLQLNELYKVNNKIRILSFQID